MPVLPDTRPEEMTSADRKIEPVRPYKVILLDDHVTTFDFVIRILISVFQKDHPTAVVLTMEVHRSGSSHVATLPREMAELRQMQVHDAARKEGFPFRCVIEPA